MVSINIVKSGLYGFIAALIIMLISLLCFSSVSEVCVLLFIPYLPALPFESIIQSSTDPIIRFTRLFSILIPEYVLIGILIGVLIEKFNKH